VPLKSRRKISGAQAPSSTHDPSYPPRLIEFPAKKMKFLRTEVIKNGPSNTVINLAMAFFPQIGRFAPYQVKWALRV
jgi:hypothetical protein